MKINFILILAASLGVAMAQPAVAPTNEPTGPVRGKTVFEDYNVTQYFETGYRSHFISPAELALWDSPEAFVIDWLNEFAKQPSWQAHRQQSRQLSLF